MISKVIYPDYSDSSKTTATPAARKEAGNAACSLIDSFNWHESAEGQEFWQSVYDRLNQIKRDGILKD